MYLYFKEDIFYITLYLIVHYKSEHKINVSHETR